MSELPIEQRRLDELTPHPQNFRAHPEAQLDEIAASISQHGIYRPVVISRDDVILAGHGLVAAARDIGYDDLPTIKLDIAHDDPRALKVLVGDNELTRLAHDDEASLLALLRTIETDDDLSGTGYDDESLRLLAELVDEKPRVPTPGDNPNPILRAERYVEILCSSSDLAYFESTLDAWGKRRGVEINVS